MTKTNTDNIKKNSQNEQTDLSNPNQLNKSFANIDLDDYLQNIKDNLFVSHIHKTALVFDKRSISYQEMGVNVAKIIHSFKQQRLDTNSVVAICLRKSPEHIYTTLACALTGIIWLPIDMDSPPARLDYLLSNSQVDIAVSNSPLSQLPSLNIQDILKSDAVNESEINALIATIDTHITYPLDRTPAYYLYTSGSTGTPKCVVLNNQSTANVLRQTIKRWHIDSNDVFIAVTPFHHDMSVFDIFAPLSVGATLVVPTFEQQKDAVKWARLVATNHVTLWCSVPAIVDMLFTVGQTEQLKSLRLIAQGGDYIKPALIAQIRKQLPNTRLFSLGGPTETTIWSIWHEIMEDDQEIIPYGKPLDHNEYFILDESMNPCAVAKVGKMYMSGINLSNGYLYDGKLHHQDFVTIKTAENDSKLSFQMSDLGYFREDGSIIFSGRTEGYLKIKGVRIAASEVENALCKHPTIQNAVVVSCTHPTTETNELVAIYTLTPDYEKEPLNLAQLRDYLKAYLPSSHIPSKCLSVDKIPLTANGKVDRKGLLKTAQETLYKKASKTKSIIEPTASVVSTQVMDTVLALFNAQIPQEQAETLSLSAQTEILSLNLKPKQFMHITTQLSQQLGISIDFYTLISCQTIQSVTEKVQQLLEA